MKNLDCNHKCPSFTDNLCDLRGCTGTNAFPNPAITKTVSDDSVSDTISDFASSAAFADCSGSRSRRKEIGLFSRNLFIAAWDSSRASSSELISIVLTYLFWNNLIWSIFWFQHHYNRWGGDAVGYRVCLSYYPSLKITEISWMSREMYIEMVIMS